MILEIDTRVTVPYNRYCVCVCPYPPPFFVKRSTAQVLEVSQVSRHASSCGPARRRSKKAPSGTLLRAPSRQNISGGLSSSPVPQETTVMLLHCGGSIGSTVKQGQARREGQPRPAWSAPPGAVQRQRIALCNTLLVCRCSTVTSPLSRSEARGPAPARCRGRTKVSSIHGPCQASASVSAIHGPCQKVPTTDSIRA